MSTCVLRAQLGKDLGELADELAWSWGFGQYTKNGIAFQFFERFQNKGY